MEVLIQFTSTLVVGFLVAYIVRFILKRVINKAISLTSKTAEKINVFGLKLPVKKAMKIPTIIFAVMMFNTVLGALGVLGWDGDIIKIGLLVAGLDFVFNEGKNVKSLV